MFIKFIVAIVNRFWFITYLDNNRNCLIVEIVYIVMFRSIACP